MNDLARLIEEQKKRFGDHPLFVHLQKTPAGTDDLAFASGMSYFVMCFSDLNKYVLPFESPETALEHAINRHCKEDAHHWKWFVRDLQRLNLDQPMTLADALKLLWSDALAASRCLTYTLIALLAGKNAAMKLAVLEATEAAGNVAFTEFVGLSKKAGLDLQYFGPLHLAHETGHAMGSSGDLIGQLKLTAEEHDMASAAIVQTFEGFHRFMDQLLAHIHSNKEPLHNGD